MVGYLPWRRMGDTKKVEDTKVTLKETNYKINLFFQISSDLSCLKYGSETARPNSMSVIESYLNVSQLDPSYFYQPPPYELMIREIVS